MSTKNIIELNGKRYDALSGKLMREVGPAPKVAPHSRVIDDVMSSVVSPDSKVPKPRAAHMPSHPHKQSNSRPTPKAKVPHKPEHAKTLMRSSVKKPTTSPSSSKRVQTLAGSLPIQRPMHLAAPFRRSSDEHRVARAQNAPKSQLVQRFATAKPTLSTTLHKLDLTKVPAKASQAVASVSNTPHQIQSRTHDILMAGLARAESHKQSPITPKRSARKVRKWPRFAGLATLVILILGIGSFLVYYNLPELEVRFASVRAGIHADLPGYIPTTFTFASPVTYEQGKVKLTFHSASSHQSFSLTEQTSSWDSDTLRDNFVVGTDPAYQTLEDGGRTIYIYGKGDATWVNSGIWYQITSSSSLSSNQLLDIAISL